MYKRLRDSTYENHAAHHVHTGAKAGEEDDLVSGNHPLAAGLNSEDESAMRSTILAGPHPVTRDALAIGLCQCPSIMQVMPSELFPFRTTHLLPSPQAIVLLEFALVVRNAVLAEDPAMNRQHQAISRNIKGR